MVAKNCVVLNCNSFSTNDNSKKYFSVPSAEPLRSVFMTFSRRGEYFRWGQICSDHFHPSCLETTKKKVVKLKKDAVPTMFREITADGEEVVVVTYDPESHRYLEESSLLNPAYSR